MNDRIRELADRVHREYIYPWDQEKAIEKFADFIVQECLDKISGLVISENVEQDIGSYEKWNQALGHAALEIEQHFYGDLK
jgi:hypothetical protein